MSICQQCVHGDVCKDRPLDVDQELMMLGCSRHLGYVELLQITQKHACANCHAKTEWISVDERLPDHCGLPVLMVAVNSYNQIRVVKGFTDYQCPITFHTNEREYDSVWAAWEVTHWMPLPEPPKMKEGAEK